MAHLIDRSYWTPLVGATSAMFIGVNEGYNPAASTTSPKAAQLRVLARLTSLKQQYDDTNNYDLRPGLIVYRPEWGCPVGGEPVAYVSARAPIENMLNMGESLRTEFKQTTVSVVDYTKLTGTSTASFIGRARGDLQQLALAWQEAAEQYFQENKIYVSCGLYREADGNIVLSAEMNPLYKEAASTWEAAAEHIMAAVEQAAGTDIYYCFRRVGFNYLRAADLPNSRGLTPTS